LSFQNRTRSRRRAKTRTRAQRIEKIWRFHITATSAVGAFFIDFIAATDKTASGGIPAFSKRVHRMRDNPFIAFEFFCPILRVALATGSRSK